MILLVLLITLIPLNCEPLKWDNLTDAEKKELFAKTRKTMNEWRAKYEKQVEITEELFTEIDTNDEIITELNGIIDDLQKRVKPKRFGVNISLSGGLNQEFNPAIAVSSDFYILFIERFMFIPGIEYQFYEVNQFKLRCGVGVLF